MNSEQPATFFGPDALVEAVVWLRDHQIERPLLISGPGRRFVGEVEAELAGMAVRCFAEARAHVPRATVDAASVALREHRADAIVTVGDLDGAVAHAVGRQRPPPGERLARLLGPISQLLPAAAG